MEEMKTIWEKHFGDEVADSSVSSPIAREIFEELNAISEEIEQCRLSAQS